MTAAGCLRCRDQRESRTGRQLSPRFDTKRLWAIVRKGPAKRIGMSDGRCTGMHLRFDRRRFLLCPHSSVCALSVPGRQIFRIGQTTEEVSNIQVILRVSRQHGIVHVPACLAAMDRRGLSPRCDWDAVSRPHAL